MSDWQDNEIIEAYATAEQVKELNETIIQLRKKIFLLQTEIQRYENLPMPRGVVEQHIQLQAKISKLERDIKYYKQYVPTKVIINRENKEQPSRRGGLRRE